MNYASDKDFFINAAVWFAIIVLLSAAFVPAVRAADSQVIDQTMKQAKTTTAAILPGTEDPKAITCTLTVFGPRVIPVIGWHRTQTSDVTWQVDAKKWNFPNMNYVLAQLVSGAGYNPGCLTPWNPEKLRVVCPLEDSSRLTVEIDVSQIDCQN